MKPSVCRVKRLNWLIYDSDFLCDHKNKKCFMSVCFAFVSFFHPPPFSFMSPSQLSRQPSCDINAIPIYVKCVFFYFIPAAAKCSTTWKKLLAYWINRWLFKSLRVPECRKGCNGVLAVFLSLTCKKNCIVFFIA